MGARWRLVVVTGLFALVTACGSDGGGDGDGVASLSEGNTPSSTTAEDDDKGDDKGDDADQMRAYAKCMREHGVDMPDPEVSQDGGIGISVNGGDKATVDKANAACKQLMPNGGEPPKPSPEDLDRMREQAQCMRDHGVDVEDPTMDDPGIKIEGGPDDENIRKAMEACDDGKGGGGKVSSGGGR